MPFWNARRSTGRALADGTAARDIEPHLEPIQLFTAEARISGWMIAVEERILDFLSEHPVLRVCVDARADVWESVERGELLVVAPPPRTGPNPRRVHRQKRRVRATIGPYVVVGVYHVPPGATPEAFIQRARPAFIALTDAILSAGDERDGGEWFDVVIVNAGRIHDLTTLISLA